MIEPETYELLFINKKAYSTTPDIELGMQCHKTFMNLPSPCETCPAKHLNNTCANYKTEFYNPYMDIWSDADASFITWKGKKAILVCCHDINKFKKPVS